MTDPKITHGYLVVKETGGIYIKGAIGIITAYLPEDEIFAFILDGVGWLTWHGKEEDFVTQFDVHLDK